MESSMSYLLLFFPILVPPRVIDLDRVLTLQGDAHEVVAQWLIHCFKAAVWVRPPPIAPFFFIFCQMPATVSAHFFPKHGHGKPIFFDSSQHHFFIFTGQ
jgi:hypothetical protein